MLLMPKLLMYGLTATYANILQLKTQLSVRIAAEEAEQKRRIDAEEGKAMLTVQLEAARGAQSASAGIADNSDLDTYRALPPRNIHILI